MQAWYMYFRRDATPIMWNPVSLNSFECRYSVVSSRLSIEWYIEAKFDRRSNWS